MRRLGRTFRKGLLVGAVIAVAYAVVRLLRPAPPGAASAGGAALDPRPAPAADPQPAEAAWAAAPRVVPEAVPTTVPVDDDGPSPLQAVLDDMTAEAVAAAPDATAPEVGADAIAPDAAVPDATAADAVLGDGIAGAGVDPIAAPPAAKKAAKKAAKAPVRKAVAKKRAAKKQAAARTTPTWADPEGRTCPPSHPVKVKTASGIFHVPGGLAYERTTPDRCYTDAAAAEADGYRPAKR